MPALHAQIPQWQSSSAEMRENTMDNNNFDRNQSPDPFYSYNHSSQENERQENGQTEFKAQSQEAGNVNDAESRENRVYGTAGGGYPQNLYQQNAYGQNEYQQNVYGQNAYQQNGMYGGPVQNEKKKKPKRERKPGGFGVKLAKCAALALVFGLVSGTAFEGVRLISRQISGEPEKTQEGSGSVLNQPDAEGKVKTTPVSSTYAATDVSDIVEATMPSIVAITNVSETEYRSFWGGRPQTYESSSAGSGIIVSQDDRYLYIVTNNHVVEGATSLTVAFNDNATVSAEIKGTDPSTDLAVIRVSLDSIQEETKGKIKAAALGNSDTLRVGEASIAVGNALGYGQSVTTGCISAIGREVSVSDYDSNTSYTAEMIQTDAAINPGNSGGALLNAVGEVIGINSVKYSGNSVEGIGYAIPISTAMPIIEDLITKEKVDESDSAFLGIAGVDVTSDVSNTYNMPSGIYVAQVTEGSAAEKAGIRKGDIVMKFDGKEVSTMDELSTRLQYYKAGTTVDVTIVRASDGEYVEHTISVELGKKI